MNWEHANKHYIDNQTTVSLKFDYKDILGGLKQTENSIDITAELKRRQCSKRYGKQKIPNTFQKLVVHSCLYTDSQTIINLA